MEVLRARWRSTILLGTPRTNFGTLPSALAVVSLRPMPKSEHFRKLCSFASLMGFFSIQRRGTRETEPTRRLSVRIQMRGFIYRQCETTTTPPTTPLHLVGGRAWYLWWYDNDRFTRRAVHWTNFEVKKGPYVEAHCEKRIWG